MERSTRRAVLAARYAALEEAERDERQALSDLLAWCRGSPRKKERTRPEIRRSVAALRAIRRALAADRPPSET